MKRIMISLIIVSFLNLIGCYYQEQMNPGDFKFNEEEDMQVTTKDTTYNLTEKDYYFENDTLFATVSKKLDKQTTLKTNIEIPINDMENIEVERTDVLLTTLTVVGIFAGTLGLIALIVGTSGGGGGSCGPPPGPEKHGI